MRINNANDLKGKMGQSRKCLLFCYECMKKYPSNEEAYKYWDIVHFSEIELKENPILTEKKYTPFTHCHHCGKLTARVMQIEKIKDIVDASNILDRLRITARQLEDIKLDYSRKFGSGSLERDTTQPYDLAGNPNDKFVEAFKNEPEKIKKAYSKKDLKKVAPKLAKEGPVSKII